jgi:hypothetical protein
VSAPERRGGGPLQASAGGTPASGQNLAELLERVLDKGIVIAGDISINLLDIELLQIKIRLLIASVDRAREMGIDWWEHDRALSGGASGDGSALEERLARLEAAAGLEAPGRRGNGQ